MSPPARRPFAGTCSLLIFLSLISVVALTTLRPPIGRLWGDEGTYVAMAASLVRDRDLEFSAADRGWAEERLPGTGVTVILQRTEDRITYSKPLLYPLLAAPFFAVAGELGMLVFNGLALAAALALAWLYLRRRTPPALACVILVTFAGTGVLLPYVGWSMSESLLTALSLAGLVLCCGSLRPATEPGSSAGFLEKDWAPLVGGVLLGLLISMRAPHAAIAIAAVLAAVFCRRYRHAALIALAVIVTALGCRAATVASLGTGDPYRAVRSSFNLETGYPIGAERESSLARFDTDVATNRLRLVPQLDAARSAYSALYFLVGRHTGVLLYFPAVLLLATALPRPDRVTVAMALGMSGLTLFYLLWLPQNYFGGATFLGNRYFLVAYPALLIALPAAPSRRWLAAVWLVTVCTVLSAARSIATTVPNDDMSQSHASAGLFRLLPYESTAIQIDGQRDRYWGGDFLRFVDPYAAVGETTFTLHSADPAAEIELATTTGGRFAVFEVRSDAADTIIELRDWRDRSSQRLTNRGDTSEGTVALRLSSGWRKHRFWWHPEAIYTARTLRLSARTADGSPATAELRYLGLRPTAGSSH